MKHTYIIVDTESFAKEEGWLVKIGRSQDPQTRLAGFRTANPGKLEMLATIPGGEWEPLLHKMLHEYRGNGEWFRIDYGRLVLLATISTEMNQNAINYDLLKSLHAVMHNVQCVNPCLAESDAFYAGWDVGEDYALRKTREIAELAGVPA